MNSRHVPNMHVLVPEQGPVLGLGLHTGDSPDVFVLNKANVPGIRNAWRRRGKVQGITVPAACVCFPLLGLHCNAMSAVATLCLLPPAAQQAAGQRCCAMRSRTSTVPGNKLCLARAMCCSAVCGVLRRTAWSRSAHWKRYLDITHSKAWKWLKRTLMYRTREVGFQIT